MSEWVESGFYYPTGEPIMVEELRWFKKINKKKNDKNESNGLSCYLFDERRFEAVRKGQKIIITADGKTTTARLFDGKSLIKLAEAKCHPDDDFDFETGAKLAFDRLISKEKSVYYNGIVKCIKEDVAGRFRVSKVYKVVDGYFVNPDGERQHTDHAPYKSISDANFWIVAIFAEVTPKTLLTNGVFGKSKTWGWFVCVNDFLIFENDGYMNLSDYDDNLKMTDLSYEENIEILVNARSFGIAKNIVKNSEEKEIIWRR